MTSPAEPRDPSVTLEQLGGWPHLLTELLAGRDLDAGDARAAMAAILAGEATHAQLIAFVVALRAKGETPAELSGLLDAVLAAATVVPLPGDLQSRALDIVGTGGDRSHSVNVSTMAALVCAGAGVPVCKHGARGASSKSGAADVLEALGLVIDLPPAGVAACLEASGFGFCFAPTYHPAFRFAAPARREIGIPTVFNLLGPMANPARVRRQLIGVADATKASLMLAALRVHGAESAWVVHGNGLDELTTTGTSTVLALHDDEVTTFEVDPIGLGFAPAIADELVGGDAADNAAAVRRVLGGEHGAHRNIVVLNAAAGLVVAGAAADLESAVGAAQVAIDSGAAMATLDKAIEASQAAAEAAG